jgi:hypothetical protein
MEFKQRTLMALVDLICGNFPQETSSFTNRSSSHITQFFVDCDTDYVHGGSTHHRWVADALAKILLEPRANTPRDSFVRVIRVLMDPEDGLNEGPDREKALAHLNGMIARVGTQSAHFCSMNRPDAPANRHYSAECY